MPARALMGLSGAVTGYCAAAQSSTRWAYARQQCERTVAGVRRGIRAWPAGESAAERKLGLLGERLIGLALERLDRHPELG